MKSVKMKLIVVSLAITAALVMSVVVGFAQQDGKREWGGGPPPPGAHEPGGGGSRGGLGPLVHDLNLTDAQKAQVKQLMEGLETSTKDLREQLFKAGGRPFDDLKDGAFDEAAVRAAAQARANIHVELEVAHARVMSQIYALLTAEQKAKLAERRQHFEQNRQQFESRGAAGGQ